MTMPKRLLMLSGCMLLATGAILWAPKKASAFFPLTFYWACNPPNGVCTFTETSNNHAMYRWNFGDGSSYGPTTSTSATHDYNFTGSFHTYTVTLVGYSTNPPGSPDNIVDCTIEALGPSQGGDPGTHGTCG
jgi:curli biogenesis system outer membrane secretion channel CsgG